MRKGKRQAGKEVRVRGVERQEGYRAGGGMVGREDQADRSRCRRRKGSQTAKENDGAGGGRAQGAKEPGAWKKGSEAGKVAMTEEGGGGGDGVRIAKDSQGPKGSRWGERIQIQEFTLGSLQCDLPLEQDSACHLPCGPPLRGQITISCPRHGRRARQEQGLHLLLTLPGSVLALGKGRGVVLWGVPALSLLTV